MKRQCMDARKNEAAVLERAIEGWAQEGLISAEQAVKLKASINQKQNDRMQIAQYFLFIALFCTLLAFAAIFLNEKLLERIKAYFSWSDAMISLISAVLAVLWFVYIGRKRKTLSETVYEIYMVLGGLALLTAIVYLCKEMHLDRTYTVFYGISLGIVSGVSILLRSRSLWLSAIILCVAWFGSWSEWAGSNNLFLGMNYPVRFTALGLLILGFSFVQSKIAALSFGSRITYIAGLLLTLMGFWVVSVFGNYNSFAEWQRVRQVHVLAYSLVFGLVAGAGFLLGIKYKDEAARDLGVLFLLINLYTRYFEYFWDTMNKGLFFLVLAITCGMIGWWLERKAKKKMVQQQ